MTLHLDDARWRASNTAWLVDEAPEVDRAWLDGYEPQDPEIAAEKELLGAMADAPPAVPLDEESVIAGALEQWEPLEPGAARSRWARRGAIAAGLLGAGVAAGLILGVGTRPHDAPADGPSFAQSNLPPAEPAEQTRDRGSDQPPAGGSEDEQEQYLGERPAADGPAPAWMVRSGRVVAEAPDASSASLPRGVPLAAAGALCVAPAPDDEVCLDDGARFEVVDGERIVLSQGRAQVSVSEGRALWVELGDVGIEAEGPCAYVVEHEVAGWSLAVEGGAPVVHTGRAHTTVQAGQTLMGKAPRTRHRRSASDLGARLAAARAARAAGDREAAVEIYEALIEASPRASQARVATVSLGQLYLELGRPKKARAAFERYLARGTGTLAEDAAFGRLRALRALGSPALERAVEEFLARYPASAYASRVKRWGD